MNKTYQRKILQGNIVFIKDNRWAKEVGRFAQVDQAVYTADFCKTLSLIDANGNKFLFATEKVRLATVIEARNWFSQQEVKS